MQQSTSTASSGASDRRFRTIPHLLRLILPAIPVAVAGCAADRPVHVHVGDDIRRPDRAAVVFFVDGFGEAQFDELLEEGRIPNIAKHILRRGVRVDNAVTCIPSITYAVSVTFITGRYPAHHGVIANKWFEPSTGRYQNYCYIKTYQRVDEDYPGSPTIYEILGRQGRVSVNIQSAIRRGVTHTIDNWALSGINWFFGNRTGVDCLIAQQFELIGQRTPLWGQWPDLIWAYFPGGDDMGHAYGPSSEQCKNAIANIDRQIGHICEALQDVGMYDQTVLALVSDHGMAAVQPNNVFDVAQHLAKRTGCRVWSNNYTEPGDEQRLLRDYDYAVAVTASRWAAVYPLPRLLADERSDVAAFAKSLDQIAAASDDAAPQPSLPGWLAEAVNQSAVELVACSFHPGVVHLFNRHGRALIVRSSSPSVRHTVRQWPPGAVVEHPDSPAVAADEPSDSRAWLEVSVGDRYPDLVPQIVAMFDSERAGNIVLFAAEDWDFSTEDPRGGHGSVLATDMRVPMLFAGPGIDPQRPIPLGRTCDLTPTLLGILAPTASPDGSDPRVDMDGVDLLLSARFR